MNSRPTELRDEAEHLAVAASFLIENAKRKLELADQLERMSRTGLGGEGLTRPAPASSPKGTGGEAVLVARHPAQEHRRRSAGVIGRAPPEFLFERQPLVPAEAFLHRGSRQSQSSYLS